MKTLSPHGAVLVDEAKVIAIINYCLFGDTGRRPVPQAIARIKKAKQNTRAPLHLVTPL